jgi:hypothetical protein
MNNSSFQVSRIASSTRTQTADRSALHFDFRSRPYHFDRIVYSFHQSLTD